MDKLVRTRKGILPFQVDFTAAQISKLSKEKKLKKFERSVKGSLYFLPNSVKLISEHELLFIEKFKKDDFKKLSVVRDVAEKEVKKAEKKSAPSVDEGNKDLPKSDGGKGNKKDDKKDGKAKG